MRRRICSLTGLSCGRPSVATKAPIRRVARQVDAFAERAAQHREADAAAARREAREEGLALGLAHAARLRPDRHRRMARGERGRDLLAGSRSC